LPWLNVVAAAKLLMMTQKICEMFGHTVTGDTETVSVADCVSLLASWRDRCLIVAYLKSCGPLRPFAVTWTTQLVGRQTGLMAIIAQLSCCSHLCCRQAFGHQWPVLAKMHRLLYCWPCFFW